MLLKIDFTEHPGELIVLIGVILMVLGVTVIIIGVVRTLSRYAKYEREYWGDSETDDYLTVPEESFPKEELDEEDKEFFNSKPVIKR